MRIIACALVIYNHTQGFYLYMESIGIQQAVYMTLTMITKINVPLFLMISGALLLCREEDYHHVLTRRACKIAAVIVVFESSYCLCDYVRCILTGAPYEDGVFTIAYRILGGRIDALGPYWYLYAYLGFLLLLPFLQRTVGHMDSRDLRIGVLILLVSRFVFTTFVPFMTILYRMHGGDEFVLSTHMNLALASSDAIFYPILGYYLEYHVNVRELREWHIIGLVSVSAASIALAGWCTCHEYQVTGAYSQSYTQMIAYVLAIATYVLVKYAVSVQWSALLAGKCGTVIAGIGSLTFGIYLLGGFYKLFVYGWFDRTFGEMLSPFGYSIAWVVSDMVVCGAVSRVLRKVPGVRRLL